VELWLYCSGLGVTPYEALSDPNLPFNMGVMRGYYKAKQVAEDMVAARAGRQTTSED